MATQPSNVDALVHQDMTAVFAKLSNIAVSTDAVQEAKVANAVLINKVFKELRALFVDFVRHFDIVGEPNAAAMNADPVHFRISLSVLVDATVDCVFKVFTLLQKVLIPSLVKGNVATKGKSRCDMDSINDLHEDLFANGANCTGYNILLNRFRHLNAHFLNIWDEEDGTVNGCLNEDGDHHYTPEFVVKCYNLFKVTLLKIVKLTDQFRRHAIVRYGITDAMVSARLSA